MKITERFIENYAYALLNLAIENKKVNDYLQICNVLIDAFKEYPNYPTMLSNIYFSVDERKKIIQQAFGKVLDKTLLNAFYLLIDREAFFAVRLILKQLRKLINSKNDIQYGNVYSVEPLTADQITRIKEKLIKKYGYSHIELVNKIDPNLIGGVQVRIKHEIIDGSLSGQLKEMMDAQLALSNKQ